MMNPLELKPAARIVGPAQVDVSAAALAVKPASCCRSADRVVTSALSASSLGSAM